MSQLMQVFAQRAQQCETAIEELARKVFPPGVALPFGPPTGAPLATPLAAELQKRRSQL